MERPSIHGKERGSRLTWSDMVVLKQVVPATGVSESGRFSFPRTRVSLVLVWDLLSLR